MVDADAGVEVDAVLDDVAVLVAVDVAVPVAVADAVAVCDADAELLTDLAGDVDVRADADAVLDADEPVAASCVDPAPDDAAEEVALRWPAGEAAAPAVVGAGDVCAAGRGCPGADGFPVEITANAVAPEATMRPATTQPKTVGRRRPTGRRPGPVVPPSGGGS